MFFNIGNTVNKNFPINHKHLDLYINLDNGWSFNGVEFYKGIEGNQCYIRLTDGGIILDTVTRRTFPVYYDDRNVSNLFEYQNEYCSNAELLLLDNKLTIKSINYQNTFRDLNLDDNQLFDYLYEYVDSKIKKFDTEVPINLFPTGGVDIALLISFILKNKKRYNLLTAEHKDMDYFVCHCRAEIGKNWAYRDIHHWKEYSVLLSGTHGDEMMIRYPQHAYMISKYHGENIIEELKNKKDLYHSHYYLRKKQNHLYEEADNLSLDYHGIKNFILGRNSFDFQHWHLGNTITWTPLNDLEICNIMLNFSYKNLKGQLLDASITKKLIERNNPNHLNLISPQKNVNHFSHLYKIFERIEELE